jgi:hypothetical protein
MSFDPSTLLGGYTEVQLAASFNIVAPKPNWKMPISTSLPGDSPQVALDQLAFAITFYTGSVASFTKLPNGKILITAPGYYSAVGA